jgi:hypothetical protein
MRRRIVLPSILCLLTLPLLLSVAGQKCSAQEAAAPTGTPAGDDYSGMYSFLKDGEFVQITIEDKGVVSGFISRFGDSESDRGTFLNQFFKSGKIDGAKLSFTTESVHGIWFTFEGSFERGPGKKPDEEAYYVLRGALTRFATDTEKKVTSQATQVAFKSFPRDAAPSQ